MIIDIPDEHIQYILNMLMVVMLNSENRDGITGIVYDTLAHAVKESNEEDSIADACEYIHDSSDNDIQLEFPFMRDLCL